jgi:hypothetical protein
MRKIYFYDPHSYMDSEHVVSVGGQTYHFQLLKLGEKALNGTWVFLMDELAVSPLSYFYPRNRRVAVLKESPVHTRKIDSDVLRCRFDLVLTHREDLIETGAPFQRVDFSTNWATLDRQSLANVKKTKLLSFVGSLQHPDLHGYGFRRAVADALSKRDGTDLFGWGIRPIEYKTEGLVPYCFSVALENCAENYYYTEKIIDCLFCDTVPIYWGCPAIHDVFDPRGMITFQSIPELMDIVENLSFESYRKMLPFVRENRDRCVRDKLASYDDYLARCVEAADEVLGATRLPLRNYQVSKVAAGGRLLADLMKRHLAHPVVGPQEVPH